MRDVSINVEQWTRVKVPRLTHRVGRTLKASPIGFKGHNAPAYSPCAG